MNVTFKTHYNAILGALKPYNHIGVLVSYFRGIKCTDKTMAAGKSICHTVTNGPCNELDARKRLKFTNEVICTGIELDARFLRLINWLNEVMPTNQGNQLITPKWLNCMHNFVHTDKQLSMAVNGNLVKNSDGANIPSLKPEKLENASKSKDLEVMPEISLHNFNSALNGTSVPLSKGSPKKLDHGDPVFTERRAGEMLRDNPAIHRGGKPKGHGDRLVLILSSVHHGPSLIRPRSDHDGTSVIQPPANIKRFMMKPLIERSKGGYLYHDGMSTLSFPEETRLHDVTALEEPCRKWDICPS